MFSEKLKNFPATLWKRCPELLVAIVSVLGLIYVMLHWDYPVVRNSLFFVEIGRAALEYGVLSQEAVAAAYTKPMGFALLSMPLSNWLGANSGLKVLSSLSTAAFLYVSLRLVRGFTDQTLRGRQTLRITVLILCVNPLIFYQFMSAYPDSLFAALFIASLMLLDRAFRPDAPTWLGSAFAIALLASVWVKHHGFVLVLCAPILMCWRWKALKENGAWYFMLPFSIALLVLVCAQTVGVPTYNLGHNTGNYLGGTGRLEIIKNNFSTLFTFLLLSFGVLLLAPLYLKSWKIPSLRWALVVVLFIAAIMFYRGSAYNPRYFLAVTPFLCFSLAVLLMGMPKKIRGVLLSGFIAGNTASCAYFNFPMVRKTIEPFSALPYVDNLRMQHEQAAAFHDLKSIERLAPLYNHQLYFFSNYYGGRVRKAWEHAGILPEDLTVIYGKKWKPKYIEELHSTQTLLYDYPAATQKPGKYFDRDPILLQHLTRYTPRLYGLDFRTGPDRAAGLDVGGEWLQ